MFHVFFLYKNSKSLLTECLLSTAFPHRLNLKTPLGFKAGGHMKNLQPWNFWQKGPRMTRVLFFRVLAHDFRKLKFIDSIAKSGRHVIPLPEKLLCKSHWAFVGGSHWTHEDSRAIFNVQKPASENEGQAAVFFIIFLAQPRNWNTWIPSIQP